MVNFITHQCSTAVWCTVIGSRPSDHYFRSLSVRLCRVFSAVFDPISIKLGHMLYVWV